MFQTLILTTFKKVDVDTASQLTPSGRAYFKQKNPSEAKSYLYHKLSLKLNLPIYIPVGMAIAIHTGSLFW